MRKTDLIKALLLVLYGCLANAQPYLNTTTLDVGGSPRPDLLVSDSTYLVACQSSQDWRQMDFGLFDRQGNLLNKKSYLYDSIADIGNCGKCLTQMYGNFYFGQTHFETMDSGFVLFQKLNLSYDTVLNYKHVDFEGNTPQLYAMTFDTDSTFIVTGYVYREISSIYKYDLWVAKFDTTFNVIWEKRLEDNYPHLLRGYRGMDIELDVYGSVIVSGEGLNFSGGGQNSIQYAFAARLDRETGDLHWLKEFSGPEGSKNMFLLDQKDGTYRFVEAQIDKRDLGTVEVDVTRLRLGIIDTAGVVLWDTLTGPRGTFFYIQDFHHTLDGNYYVSGDIKKWLPYYYNSAAYKFGPQGDSLWFRTYHYEDSADISHIWSFKPTPDSGFVHIGTWSDFHNTQEQFTHTWFLKTDKYGCDTAGCHTVNLREYRAPLGLQVYPNPSRGSCTLELPHDTKPQHLRAEIYNLNGKSSIHSLWRPLPPT